MRSKKPYWMRCLLTLDQTVNVFIFNGDEDHTVSGRVGFKALLTQGRFWLSWQWLINKLFWFEEDHCFNAIEWDRIGGTDGDKASLRASYNSNNEE